MAAVTGGGLFGNVCSTFMKSLVCTSQPGVLFQVRGYAARKGTREKARKSKVKFEIKRVGFIPHNQRKNFKDAGALVSKRLNDSCKPTSPDNVWVAKYYKWKIFSFVDAVQCHRETHHPTVSNLPNAPLVAYIELNMQGAKKTKFVDKFIRTVDIPHPFPQQSPRTILALCKGDDIQQLAAQAGATLAGGSEIIKKIMVGDIALNDYNVVVAHPNILPELVALRGLLKKRFPNMKDGNLSVDVAAAVNKFVNGIEYKAFRDDREMDFGWIEVNIGTLDMDPKHLETNFAALVNDVNLKKPKREGDFITRTLLLSPPSVERLKIDFELYVTTNKKVSKNTDNDADDEDDDDEAQAAASAN